MSILPLTCLFYRITGSLLSCTSMFTIILIFRYFFKRYRRYQQRLPISPLSPILIGMLISLIIISCTGIPLVLVQCFTCQPFKINIRICKINAFICFTIGTFNMYMLVLLSIFRYINIIHKHSLLSHIFEHYRGLSVIICAFISLCWSIPPFINIENHYIDERIGFYCSFDWNNSIFHSRLFVYSLLICNYFILLFILIYSNLRIYFILRYLLKLNKYSHSSLTSTFIHSNIIYQKKFNFNLRKYLSDKHLKQKFNRLQQLKIDQRYAHITAIMIIQFIIAWTPYAIVAILIINGHMEFLRQYPIYSIISEFLVTFSLIINPLILIYTNKMS